jgi:hypothetical protein
VNCLKALATGGARCTARKALEAALLVIDMAMDGHGRTDSNEQQFGHQYQDHALGDRRRSSSLVKLNAPVRYLNHTLKAEGILRICSVTCYCMKPAVNVLRMQSKHQSVDADDFLR